MLHPLKKKMLMDNNCLPTVSEMFEFHGEIDWDKEIRNADDITQQNVVLVHKS